VVAALLEGRVAAIPGDTCAAEPLEVEKVREASARSEGLAGRRAVEEAAAVEEVGIA